jgi:putative membrane protein
VISKGVMGMWYMINVNGWWMAAGWALMALIWVGIAVLAILAFKWFLRHNEASTKQSPLDIARVRYAKGEITKEQFEQIKEDWGG